MVQIKQQLPAYQISRKASSWEWLQGKGLKHSLEHVRGNPRRSRVQVWLLRLSTSILLWTCFVQLMALGQLWQPRFLKGWPSCFERTDFSAIMNSTSSNLVVDNSTVSFPLAKNFTSSSLKHPLADTLALRSPSLRPARVYKSNGYLLVSCNGGLNQMRAAICDMVAIARQLNLTLVIPELDKTSFWADPSEFKDIFDVKYFIASLKDEVRIVKMIPAKYHEKVRKGRIPSLPPVSWSNESYYQNKILPLIKKHKVLHFTKTDTRLVNNGLPSEMQRLRCRVNYESLRFTPALEEMGQKLLTLLQSNGPFVVLHLRYEMDMLAFSGCTHGCTDAEAQQLTNMRYAYPWWKEKIIDSVQKRLDGLCPLTPEETVLVLRALGFDKDTQIYIAAGEIYGSERRLAPLRAAYPNLVRKELLLSPAELKPFQNHSSQMAALDYLVAVASDVFIPTYDGNMAKVVQGHRRYLGYRKTILLDHRRLVELLDQYHDGILNWHNFSLAVQEVHSSRMGTPSRRRMIPDRPKEEDYFYANPEECFA